MSTDVLQPWTGVRIAGHPGPSDDQATFTVVEPATGQELAQVRGGGRDAAESAVDAAASACSSWAATPVAERSAALGRIAGELRASARGELATILTRESGKRLEESTAELELSAAFFDWFARVAATKAGQTWRVRPGVRHEVGWRPLGVVAILTPWNFPVSIPARKIAPALAAGCPVVFKPSQLTPLSALMLAEIVERHVPSGVVNTVAGDARTVTDAWLADGRVRGLSFTGSTAVGRSLASRAGGELKRCTLELGGRAPFIVLEDAAVQDAVDQLMVAKFRNNGQSCIAANHVWVARTLWEEVIEAFVARCRELSVGDPTDPDTDLGPVRTAQAMTDLQAAVDEARKQGAQVVTGGRDIPSTGSFLPPTICLSPPADVTLWREEVFGPVAPLRPFDDVEEPLRDANASPYGLAGYVCTGDPERGAEILARLEVGIGGVNVPSPNTPQIPFGGQKASGLGGYEGGLLGIEPFVEYQSVAIRA